MIKRAVFSYYSYLLRYVAAVFLGKNNLIAVAETRLVDFEDYLSLYVNTVVIPLMACILHARYFSIQA